MANANDNLPLRIIAKQIDLSTSFIRNRTFEYLIDKICTKEKKCETKLYPFAQRILHEFYALEPWRKNFPLT